MSTAEERKAAVKMASQCPDIVATFGITRDDILAEIGRQGAESVKRESGGDFKNLVHLSLAEACRYLHLTRDEIRRVSNYVNHGKRNQVISIREIERLIEKRTITTS